MVKQAAILFDDRNLKPNLEFTPEAGFYRKILTNLMFCSVWDAVTWYISSVFIKFDHFYTDGTDIFVEHQANEKWLINNSKKANSSQY